MRLHPGLTQVFAAKVSELSHALNDPALRTEAVEILRGLVSAIRMVPQPDGSHEIELSGDLAAILALATGQNAKARLGAGPAGTLVAGAGFGLWRNDLALPSPHRQTAGAAPRAPTP